jgi:hypothetical protein
LIADYGVVRGQAYRLSLDGNSSTVGCDLEVCGGDFVGMGAADAVGAARDGQGVVG